MVIFKCQMLLSEITDIGPLEWNKELKPEENNTTFAPSPM